MVITLNESKIRELAPAIEEEAHVAKSYSNRLSIHPRKNQNQGARLSLLMKSTSESESFAAPRSQVLSLGGISFVEINILSI